MSRVIYGNLDLATNQMLNIRLQMLPSDPSPLEAQIYYNSTSKEVRYHNGTTWLSLGAAGGAAPIGAAGGDLAGTYPNPTIKADVIVDADVNTAAAIQQSKISGLVTALAGKVPSTRLVTAGAGLLQSGTGDLSADFAIHVGAGQGIGVAADAVYVDSTSVQFKSEKGVANGYAPLDASNLIPTAHMPPLAINDVFTVASEAAMLALTAQVGDMAIRTDTGKTYVLSASPASTLVNWKEVMATGQVVSVNAMTGVVLVTLASLGGVPTARQVIAGAGLTGGGALSGDVTLNVAGDSTILANADYLSVQHAPKWTNARTLTLSGDVTGSASVDGSQNIAVLTTVSTTVPKKFWITLAASSPHVITHGMNTREVQVTVYAETAPYAEVEVEVEHTSLTAVTLRWSPAMPAGGHRVVIFG